MYTMKQLQLTPPLLIITMGYPGSGKTFFARQLSEAFEIPRISENRLRFELFEKPQFNLDESDIITRIMDYNLEQLFKTKQTIICEGLFLQAKSRAHIYTLARAAGYKTLTVWLQTDIQTSATRAIKRDRRNPDSKHSFNLDQRTFNFLKDQLQRPSEKEEFVVISGKHAFKSQTLTILKRVAGMYADSIEQSTIQTQRVPQRPNQLIQ